MKQLSNRPPKGTSDWLPDEFKIRKYIFDIWRETCLEFGFQEYLTPVFESADIYRAKSGEDIGGKELMIMTDKAGRELAVRPEMTPSVTRMVSRIYDASPKPLKFFSIANFVRNEKPQRGRNREFWQLNFDIFGSNSINADIEILQIALEIILRFNPPKGSFTMFINNRILIDEIISGVSQVQGDIKKEVVRVLDKFDKLTFEEFEKRLLNLGLSKSQIQNLLKFLSSKNEDELLENLPSIKNNKGFGQIKEIMAKLSDLGYLEWIRFQPNIIRGFDYYDGMVFEVFDNNPQNSRSMFGGGRYNGLANLFGGSAFPAVGCAPGDETTKIFLESWNLLNKTQNLKSEIRTYLPLLDEKLYSTVQNLAKALRQQGRYVEVGLEVQKVGKALDYANKKRFSQIIILGENEIFNGVYIEKDMESGEQKEVSLK